MDNTHLPHNDPDLQLAKKIGECRDNNVDLRILSDDLPEDLLAYKKYSDTSEKDIPVPQNQMWKNIEKEISDDAKSSRILPFKSSRRRAWSIAAAILLAALVSLFYLTRSQEPLLLAETGSSLSEVELHDGSMVTLRPHSALWKVSESTQKEEYRLEGEGYFNIINNPEREFSVVASEGKVVVLGTKFVLSNWGNRTTVFLEEGSVRFQQVKTGDQIDLKPEEKATIDENNKLIPPEPAKKELYTSWLNNQLQFSDRPARLIFDELEHHFQITIQAPEKIEQEPLGGGISLDEKEEALQDLGMVLDGSFETDDGKTYNFVADAG